MPMSSLNVMEWSADQVADWLTGLGPTVARYVPSLRDRGLDGPKLLALRCDDLEYLGMHIIGHQELLLEAVEHLRNFQYEVSRECVQQLALRVSVVATTLTRALRHHSDKRLETQALADVARTVHAVKPLVCWLDRLCAHGAGGVAGVAGVAGALAERRAVLLKLSLEAATSAMRERFAEQPARAVQAAAAATASTADFIIQDVSDPMILQGASLDTVVLRQGGRALGFDVVPSFCGHHQLADIRFGSPAHASGAVHIGDEIVQVGNQCVIGWSGAAVLRLCASVAGAGGGGGGAAGEGSEGGGAGELALRVRRRAARAPAALATPQLHRMHRLQRFRPPLYVYGDFRELGPLPASPAPARAAPARAPASPPASPAEPASSDESEPLSPPASPTSPTSPTHLHSDHTRMYPPKPRAAPQRRHTIAGASPLYKHTPHTIHQFWQELKQQHWGREGGSTRISPTPEDIALYARDKAVSYSTGLELSPRPRTCLGVVLDRPRRPSRTEEDAAVPSSGEKNRGKLDKAHSTPAYDFDASIDEPGPLAAQTIPESPTTPTDHPELKKDLTERDRERVLETINVAMLQHRRRSAASPHRADAPPPPPPALRLPRNTSSRAPEPPPRPVIPARPSAIGPGTGTSAGSTGGGGVVNSAFPVLRAVPRVDSPPTPSSPLKPLRPTDVPHISVPLRHITKHDIRMIPSERRELPAINSEQEACTPTSSLRRRSPPALSAGSPAGAPGAPPTPDIVIGAHAQNDSTPTRGSALSPQSAVRGIFPTSKSRSLKKKSSILAKRRLVPLRALAARGALGAVWQRVRARHAQQPRWARRHLLLTHNLLYAYRDPECSKADCMIYLEGFTVSAAGEVKSRAHAFKVYHTGTAFYFACDSRDAMLSWIQLIHRATLLPSLATNMDVSKQFSETDYSETESDAESPAKGGAERQGGDKEKDKSKFGSLKKLTGRMQRSESHEHVPHSSTSLDRKYLRFFSRSKPKDDDKNKPNKIKQSGVPIPTEHYRSYRKVPTEPPATTGPASPGLGPAPPVPGPAGDADGNKPRRLPKPINYIHASNPNLLDFDKSDFVTKPTLHIPPKPKPKTENLMGFVTLEQFMLKKQAEERRQNRDVQAHRPPPPSHHAPHAPHPPPRTPPTHPSHLSHAAARLDHIVADVIYGEVGPSECRPVSVRGKDGYEKLVYRDELSSSRSLAHERWRDSLRRNDKVHSAAGAGAGVGTAGTARAPLALDSWSSSAGSGGGGGGGGGSGGGGSGGGVWGGRQYPHLVCPPTFQPETYSLARLPHSLDHSDA